MTNTMRGLRAFGLSLLAIVGSMAVVAAGAQAITWDVGGSEIGGNVTAKGNLVAGQEVLILVVPQNLIIHCTGLTEVIIFLPGNIEHDGILFTGCQTLVKGVKNAGCKPEILEFKSSVKPVLHNSRVYLLASPQVAGGNFTTIHYNEETCALPPLPVLKGSISFECYTGALVAADCKTARVTQLIRPVENQALLGDELLYGLNQASIQFEAEVSLTGGNAGKTWNALI